MISATVRWAEFKITCLKVYARYCKGIVWQIGFDVKTVGVFIWHRFVERSVHDTVGLVILVRVFFWAKIE